MIQFDGRSFGCPVEVTLSVLGGKWKTVILARIKEGDSRFGMLRRSIPELSARVLTLRLRELERAGLVTRTVRKRGPPSEIEYRLSPLGDSLRSVLSALWGWGVSVATDPAPQPRPHAGKKPHSQARRPGN